MHSIAKWPEVTCNGTAGRGGAGRATPLTVSVLLATCNGERFLEEQLATIAAQSVLPAELVVCDDASSDETPGVLARFAATAPFPMRITSTGSRLGFRANFMRGTGLCRGDLIAFCDQDDRWHPGKLESMVAAFTGPSVLLAFHDAAILHADGTRAGSIYPNWRRGIDWPALTAFPWAFSPGLTQVFRRSLCALDWLWPLSVDHTAPGERLAHDRWYFFLASVLGTIRYVPERLVDYRQHEANTYGMSGLAPQRLRRWRGELATAGEAVDLRATAAANRAALIEQIGAAMPEVASESLRAAAVYREFAERYRGRVAAHAGASVRQRLAAMLRLLAVGGYGRGGWRFGVQALALDLLGGVMGLGHGAAAPGQVADG